MFRSKQLAHILFLSLLATLVLGAFNRISLSNSVAINLSDPLALLFLAYALLNYHPLKQKLIRSYATWVTLVAAIFLASLIPHLSSTPPVELATAALYSFRWYVYFLLPIACIPYFQQNPKHTKYITHAFLLISLFGLVQFVLLPNLQFLEKFGYDPHYYRLVSTWLDPNFLGAALVFALLYSYSESKRTLHQITILSIIALALLLTFSRSAYITLAVAGTLYAIFMRSWRTIVLLAAVFVVILATYFVPRAAVDSARNIDRSFSANLRLLSYGQAAEIFMDYPVTGAGYDLVRFQKRERGKILDVRDGGNSGAGIDSSWLLVLATTGIVGLLIYLSFWIRTLYFALDPAMHKSKPFQTLLAFFKKPKKSQALLVSLLIAWFLHAWFINSLFFVPIIIIWTLIFSATIAKEE